MVVVLTAVSNQSVMLGGVPKDLDVGSYELLNEKGEVVEKGQDYVPERVRGICHR